MMSSPPNTPNPQETPQDLADFVEYCWGPASSPFGKQRAAFRGKDEPFKNFYIEIGNEQKPTLDLLNDVLSGAAGMQARAQAIGLERRLGLIVGGMPWTQENAAPFIDAFNASSPIGTSKIDWFLDFHIGGDSLSATGLASAF